MGTPLPIFLPHGPLGAREYPPPRRDPIDTSSPALPSLEDAFDLQVELGRGAMGVVLRGKNRVTGRGVAIKLPLAGADTGMRERILREAELLRKVAHPRLTAFLGCYRDREDRLALVYELIEGESLEPLADSGRLPARRALALVADIAEGLDALHRAGLVHRDLKPANVMVEPDGRARILDFGLARPERSGRTLTDTGNVLGTPLYMAPETIRGERCSPATDQYALACIAFELLARRSLFLGEPTQVIAQHLGSEPPSVRFVDPDLPASLDAAFGRSLAKDPAVRYPTCTELARSLMAAFAQQGTDGGRTAELTSSSPSRDPAHTVPLGRAGTSSRTRIEGSPGPASRAGSMALAGFLALGLGAAAHYVGTGVPETQPSIDPTATRAAATVSRVRKEVDGDPAVQTALGLSDYLVPEGEPGGRKKTLTPQEATDLWITGRSAYVRLVRDALPALRELVETPFSPAAHLDVERLKAIAHALDFRRPSPLDPRRKEIPPLFPPEERPAWGRLARRGLMDKRLPALEALHAKSEKDLEDLYREAPIPMDVVRMGDEAFELHAREELDDGARTWKMLRNWREFTDPAKDLFSDVRPRNFRGEVFPLETRSAIPELFADVQKFETGMDDAPSELELDLAEPAGDLWLVLVTFNFNERDDPFQLAMDLVGREDTRTLYYLPLRVDLPEKEAAVLDFERNNRRVAATIRIRRDLLPAGLRKLRLSVLGLKPIGDPSGEVGIQQIFQLVAGPAPEGFDPWR